MVQVLVLLLLPGISHSQRLFVIWHCPLSNFTSYCSPGPSPCIPATLASSVTLEHCQAHSCFRVFALAVQSAGTFRGGGLQNYVAKSMGTKRVMTAASLANLPCGPFRYIFSILDKMLSTLDFLSLSFLWNILYWLPESE